MDYIYDNNYNGDSLRSLSLTSSYSGGIPLTPFSLARGQSRSRPVNRLKPHAPIYAYTEGACAIISEVIMVSLIGNYEKIQGL